MRGMFLPAVPNKDDYVHLIRHCGWGAPDLSRALWSAGDSLTLLVEDQVHPYAKVQGKGIVTRDMNLHSLPWPKDELGRCRTRLSRCVSRSPISLSPIRRRVALHRSITTLRIVCDSMCSVRLMRLPRTLSHG